MGLDIFLRTNNEIEHKSEDLDFEDYELSRSFCNLMFRDEIVGKEKAEWNQIEKIAKIDLTPIHEMSKDEAPTSKNIQEVYESLKKLLENLEPISNLYELLEKTSEDTIGSKRYFSQIDLNLKAEIGHGFGKDLLTIKKFIQAAIKRGSESIYFEYG